MQPLNLSRWQKVWLSQPWNIRPVPGTSMVELNDVRGFLTVGDVVFLFNLAGSLPPGGRYLEVGSWQGLSSIILANSLIANLNFDAKIYCVDTWRGSIEHQEMDVVKNDQLYEVFLGNVREAQVERFIEAIRGASVDVAATWSGPALDVIFIDGDHSFEACYDDIRCWRSRLKPDGRMLGHDATPGGDVERAVQRFCRETGLAYTVSPMPHSHFIWEIHGSPSNAVAPTAF